MRCGMSQASALPMLPHVGSADGHLARDPTGFPPEPLGAYLSP